MSAWILVAVIIGLLVAVWHARRTQAGAVHRQSPFMGFLAPMLFVMIFARQLLELIPGLTLVDISALFIMGGVSGYFLHTIVTRRDAHR